MKLDRNLNLVMRLTDDSGDFVVHSVPLPSEVYSANYKLLRAAYEELTNGGIKSAISTSVYILKDVGVEMNREAQANSLIDTIASATTIIRSDSKLLNHSDLDEDFKMEVLNRLVFFTVWEFFVLPTERKDFWESISYAMNLERTKLNVSDLLSSSTTPSVTSETTLPTSEPTIVGGQSFPT